MQTSTKVGLSGIAAALLQFGIVFNDVQWPDTFNFIMTLKWGELMSIITPAIMGSGSVAYNEKKGK